MHDDGRCAVRGKAAAGRQRRVHHRHRPAPLRRQPRPPACVRTTSRDKPGQTIGWGLKEFEGAIQMDQSSETERSRN